MTLAYMTASYSIKITSNLREKGKLDFLKIKILGINRINNNNNER
jgi:hypothetical protein